MSPSEESHKLTPPKVPISEVIYDYLTNLITEFYEKILKQSQLSIEDLKNLAKYVNITTEILEKLKTEKLTLEMAAQLNSIYGRTIGFWITLWENSTENEKTANKAV